MFHKLLVFEIEIASSPQDLKVYSNDFEDRYVSAFLSGAPISSNKICKVLQSKHFQPSHITKKTCGFVESADFIAIF